MIKSTRFSSGYTGILILGFVLFLQPFQTTHSQVVGNYKLGPQLIPVESKTTGQNTYAPWQQVLTSNCTNSDFSSGDWSRWEGCYGLFNNSCQIPGFKTTNPHPLHKLIPGPGWLDHNTCDTLLNVFPGENFCARLGDTIYSSATNKSAELKYQVDVSSDSYLFIYRYAVVLQTGGHQPNQQPDFKVMITDQAGHVLDSTCGYYYITAQYSGPPVNGWHRCQAVANGDVYWKDWTTVGMDLTPYLGQIIFVVFKVRSCTFNTHFGYAYISSYCNQLEIQTALCEGQDSAVLTAPPGFTYLWEAVVGDPSIDGDTTASITVPSVEGSIYKCTLTALNGCSVTITNTLKYTQIHAGFDQTLNCAQRPSSFTDTTWVSQNDVTAWRWFFGDPASGASDSSNIETPVHSFTAAGNYDVTLISYSTEGCCDTTVKQITIDSLPDVSNTSFYKIICSHDSTDIHLTSNVSATLFTWTATSTSPLITGYSNQITPVSYLNQHLTNNGNTIDSVIYSVTPHNSTCAGNDTNFYVAVYPHPNLTNPVKVKSICDSTFTNIILQSNLDTTRFTWTCTASSPNVTGYSNNITTPDTLINQLLRNSGYTTDTVYYHIMPHGYGCLGDTTIYKVAVYPVADLSNIPLSKTICDSTLTGVTLTSHVAGTTFTWTCTPSSGNITGWSDNNTGTTILNQRLDNLGTAIETVTYHIVPKANGCNGHTTNFTVTVNPTPHLTNPSPVPICSASSFNVTLVPDVTGANFTWTATCNPIGSVTGFTTPQVIGVTTIADVLTNNTSNFATVTYRITAHANGCDGPAKDFTVQINPTPHLTNGPPAAVCSGSLFSATLVPDVTGANFTWTASCNPVGSVTGFTNPQLTNVTVISDILTNTTFATATVTYHITPHANGCDGPLTDFTVTVKPTPDLSNTPKNKQQCNNQPTNITLTSNVAGTLFTWTANGSSFQITGYSDNSTPTTTLNQTLINSGFNIETVTYHISPKANGCNGTVTDFVVTVYPTPDLSNSPKNKQQCNNIATNITLTTNVTGTLFTWTATGSSVLVSGYSDNSTPTTVLNQTLINSGYKIETVTYHITPRANGCDGVVTDYVVTVYPVPDLSNNPPNKQQCTNQPTNILLTSNVAGTLFTWTCTPSSGNITGFANSINPTALINQTLINTGFNIETVVYHITPVANGCNGVVTDYTVTVFPAANLSNTPASKQICNNTSTNITLTSNVTGTLFTWTCTPSSANVTGFSNSINPTTLIDQTLVNSGFNIETVTYHIMPAANGCNGIPADYVVTVYPTPDLSNNPKSKTQCNNTSTNITLTSNVTGTLFTWTCTPSSGNVTGFANSINPGTLINQLLANSGYNIETVTYHVSPHANGCDGAVTDYTVTVYPTPDLSNTPMNKQQCNNLPTNITLTSNVTGTLFTWTATGSSFQVTGYSDNPIPTTILNQTLINSGFNIEMVTYHITPKANGCSGSVTDFVVTVYPTPDLSNTPKNKQQCNNIATNITLTSNVSGTLFTWTATGSSVLVSGYSDNSIPTVTLNQTLINSGYNIETVTYHITPQANGCDGVMTDYIVTVYPTADAYYQPPSQTICTGQTTNVDILSHVTGTTFTWTASASSPLVIGYSNGGGTQIIQTLLSSSINVETVTYVITPVANGCTGTASSLVITLNPGPAVTTTPLAQTICSAQGINIGLTSNVSGTAFSWTASASSPNITGFSGGTGNTISQTLVNSGYTIETVTYAITPSANGCTGAPVNYVVTVNPVPDLSNTPANQQQCNNQSTSLTLTSNVAGTLFTWTCTPSSANITGWSNSVTPGTVINQTLINAGVLAETVTYHLTPHANGCDGPVTDYVVTVIFKPALTNNPLSKAICNNTSTNITLTANVSGTLFTWLAIGSSPGVTGYSDNTTNPTVTLDQTLMNSSNIPQTVTYRIVPHAIGCEGDTTNYVVTVQPTANLTTLPLNKQQCNNQQTNITLLSNVAGTLFTWTCTPSSANVSGFANSINPVTLINQVLVNSGYNIETVTYHITPNAYSCDGPVSDYVVTVYPTTDAYYQPPSQTICTGQTTNVDILSHVTGTTFTWTASASSPLVVGYSNGGGTQIIQTLLSSSTNIETVTYVVTPLANGCTGTTSSLVITVNPGPAVTTTPLAQTICSAQGINIGLTSNVSGTAFNWTASASSPNITGFSGGAGNTISQTLVNSGYTIEIVTYAITPSANGCTGPPVNYVVTVNPVPDLSNSPKNQQQCNNQSTNLTLTSNVSGTLFTWTCTPSSANITGWSNSVTPGTVINQTLINAGVLAETVTYHLTPHANGCDGPVTDYVVTVIFKPALTNNPLSKAICNNTSTNITLTANVSGTLFTWLAIGSSPGVTGYSDNITNPTVTLDQTLMNSSNIPQTVTYRIVPHAIGCEGDTTNYVVTVQPTANLTTLPLNKQQCNNQQTNITLLSNVAGTLFTWTCTPSSANVSGFANSINPVTLINQVLVNSGYNIETVTYHITPNAYSCNGPMADYVVTVYPVPDIYFLPASQILCNGQTTNIQNLSHVTGTTFTWTASGSSPLVSGYSGGSGVLIQQTLVNSGTTIETVTYVTTPVANGCTGLSQNVTVTVNPTPHVTTTPLNQTICTGSSITVNLTSGVSGSTFVWTCTASSPNLGGFTAGSGNVISQTLTNTGFTIETVTYHITPTANGCSGPVADYVVTVNPKPDVSNNPLSSQICSGTSPNIMLTSHVSGTNFSWTATGSSPNITGYGPGSGTIINQVLTNLGLSIETVTYHITPTANGCTGTTVDYIVTIVSTPDVYFQPPAQTICNAASCSLQVLSHVPGATFTWTASGSSVNVSGYSAGSGNLIQQTLFNSGTTIETVTYTVTPTAFGCPPGLSQNVVVTVNPKPAITNNSTNSQICSATATGIVPQSSVTGSSYSWIASGSSGNVTGFTNGNGLVIIQTLTNSGFNLETVTYSVTPVANGCPGNPVAFIVTVFPVADAYYTPPSQAICPLQTSNITINSHVTGTTYTWTATGSSFQVTGYSGGSGNLIQQTLNNSSYNIETVTYHVSPTANGCPGTNNDVVVTVNPDPQVTFTACWDIITTTNAQPITLKGGIPLNGTYSGTGVSGGKFYPAIAGPGTFTISYYYSNLYTCNDTANQSITVIAPIFFTCGNTLTDIRDNRSYPTVQIGGQCWMSSNLDYGSSMSGTLTQRDNCTPEKFCYNDNPGNCTSMGGLYQWDELMQYSTGAASQGLCPPEWHVPTETEWNILFNYYISNGFAGSPLKSTGYSGFNAYLDGTRFGNVSWNFLNFATLFWSSNARGNNKAWAHGLNDYNPSVSFYPGSRRNAFSVRCIKD